MLKAQMLIWHLFFAKPKYYFGTTYKSQILFLTLFLLILNPPFMENIIIHPSKKYLSYKIYKSL